MEINLLKKLAQEAALPIDPQITNENLSVIIDQLPLDARNSLLQIILLYFSDSSDVPRDWWESEKINLPYGGLSTGIGAAFKLNVFPEDLLKILKTYLTLLLEIY